MTANVFTVQRYTNTSAHIYCTNTYPHIIPRQRHQQHDRWPRIIILHQIPCQINHLYFNSEQNPKYNQTSK